MIYCEYLGSNLHDCIGSVPIADYIAISEAIEALSYDSRVIACGTFMVTPALVVQKRKVIHICCDRSDPLDAKQQKELFDLFRAQRLFIHEKSKDKMKPKTNFEYKMIDDLTLGND